MRRQRKTQEAQKNLCLSCFCFVPLVVNFLSPPLSHPRYGSTHNHIYEISEILFI
jgi:hypothetical protein